ncbi:hypothetical protein BV22DRAFT_753142 [Leucogyrophana mollusca]|uniref:Uncharacterized protein n=1 Tax=Leucogyrophana mollusca TaxID=85980 RepID=A0ACB8B6E6_9AGAM|nr:hypothetical protein BV22DRAFT_753142 [Leucogyrophana mollusca]
MCRPTNLTPTRMPHNHASIIVGSMRPSPSMFEIKASRKRPNLPPSRGSHNQYHKANTLGAAEAPFLTPTAPPCEQCTLDGEVIARNGENATTTTHSRQKRCTPADRAPCSLSGYPSYTCMALARLTSLTAIGLHQKFCGHMKTYTISQLQRGSG